MIMMMKDKYLITLIKAQLLIMKATKAEEIFALFKKVYFLMKLLIKSLSKICLKELKINKNAL